MLEAGRGKSKSRSLAAFGMAMEIQSAGWKDRIRVDLHWSAASRFSRTQNTKLLHSTRVAAALLDEQIYLGVGEAPAPKLGPDGGFKAHPRHCQAVLSDDAKAFRFRSGDENHRNISLSIHLQQSSPCPMLTPVQPPAEKHLVQWQLCPLVHLLVSNQEAGKAVEKRYLVASETEAGAKGGFNSISATSSAAKYCLTISRYMGRE
jgi:hypothetical protein